jgi:hypothetical protein
MGAAWTREARRRYEAVRADEVRPGDIYANGATVTASRPAVDDDCRFGRPSINGRRLPLSQCWHLEMGQSMSTTCAASKPVVVGRLQEPA